MDLVSEYQSAVRAAVARLLRRPKDDPDVEDCENETFRRALESQHRLRTGEPVRPWILGIARHVALDALRAHYRTQARIQPAGLRDADAASAVEQYADRSSSPEGLAAHRERAAQLAAVLQTLPDAQRQALELFHMEELSYREISERLGVPTGTVGTWVLRARQTVVAALQDDPPQSEPSGGTR